MLAPAHLEQQSNRAYGPNQCCYQGHPCVKGRATNPLAFLRSLEKSSQRPLPLIFSAGYVDSFH